MYSSIKANFGETKLYQRLRNEQMKELEYTTRISQQRKASDPKLQISQLLEKMEPQERLKCLGKICIDEFSQNLRSGLMWIVKNWIQRPAKKIKKRFGNRTKPNCNLIDTEFVRQDGWNVFRAS